MILRIIPYDKEQGKSNRNESFFGKGIISMNKKFMIAAALAATTFSAGLTSNVVNANPAPVQLQQHQQAKAPQAEPQKDAGKDVKKPAKQQNIKPQSEKQQPEQKNPVKPQPPKAR